MKLQLTAILILSALAGPSSIIAGRTEKYVPTDAERARWTMWDMRTLATAIEAYALDMKAYPAVDSLEKLVPLIQPNYIRKAPAADAWGHAYTFVPGPDGGSYRLISSGADGKTDPASWEKAGPLTSFDDDAVFDSGSMTRPWPFN